MSSPDSGGFLQQVYSAQNNEDLKDTFNQWAGKYDEHVNGFGYMIPAIAAGLFSKYVPPDTSPILDAGVGTGLMGSILDAMGYGNQVGIDLSAGMLEMAAKRKIYIALHEMTLGEELDFPSGHFGACQSVGVFTTTHGPSAAFDELVRVLRPDAYIIFSVLEDAYITNGFKDKFESLTQAGKWQLIEKTKAFAGLLLVNPDLLHRVYVYQVI